MGAAASASASVPEFQRRVVAVVGAVDITGQELCRHFGRHGAFVGVIDGSDAIAALVAELRGDGVTVAPSVADLGVSDAVLAAFRHVVARLGPIDILINNGIGRAGTRHCIDAVLPDMTARRCGLIVNIGAVNATAEAGARRLAGMTKSSAAELRSFDIRVNAVQPARGCLVEADDVVRAIAFLASSSGSAVTGTVLSVGARRRAASPPCTPPPATCPSWSPTMGRLRSSS